MWNQTKTPDSIVDQTSVPHKAPIVYTYSAKPNNVIIRNVSINGTMEIGDFSLVRIENVKFYDATLIIEDNAIVSMKNFTYIGSLQIYLLNVAKLNLQSNYVVTGDSLVINLYNSSKLELYGNASATTIYSYDSSQIVLSGSLDSIEIHASDYSQIQIQSSTIDSININLEDNCELWIENSNDNSTASTFTLRGSSKIHIRDSALQVSWIYSYDYGSVDLKNTSIAYINAHEHSDLQLFNITADTIYAWGSVIFNITESTLHEVRTYIESRQNLYSANGIIFLSHIDTVYLSTVGATTLRESEISTLYYTTIHTGVLQVEDSNITSSSNYTNYINVSSNIGSIVDTGLIIAYEASSVTFNSSTTVYLIEVSHANIYSATLIYALSSKANLTEATTGLTLVSINSSVNISNIEISSINLQVTNSTLTINNLIADNFYAYTESSLVRINDSFLNKPRMYLFDSNANINSTVFNDTDYISLQNATLYLESSTINTTTLDHQVIFMVLSLFIAKDSNISAVMYSDFTLRDGLYTMRNGVVINTENIEQGVAILGSSNAENLINRIDNIYLYNAELIFEAYKLPPEFEVYTSIYLYNSSNITIRTTDSSAWIQSNGYSKITIQDSRISEISADTAQISIYNVSLEEILCGELYGTIEESSITDLYADQVDLGITKSNISNVEINTNAIIEINNANIEKVSVGTMENILFSSIMGIAQVYVNNSIVKELNAMSYGAIHIEDSAVDTLYYTFARVTLENVSLNYTLMNYLIDSSGEVTIDHNTLPASAINLLSYDSDTSIAMYGEALVFNRSDLTLRVENSEYMGILGTNGTLILSNSKLNIIMLFYTNIANVSDVYINSTFTDEPPPSILMGNYVYVTDTKIEGSGLIVALANMMLVNITTDLGLMVMNSTGSAKDIYSPGAWSYIYASNISLEDSDLSMTNLQEYYANIIFDNVTINRLTMQNSSAEINDVKLSIIDAGWSNLNISDSNISIMLIREGTTVSIHNSNVSSIKAMTHYNYGDISYLEFPEKISISIVHSNVTSTFVYYDIFSEYGELSDTPPIDNSYGLKTSYIDSSPEKIYTYLVDVSGYSIINITDFGTNISMVRIFTEPDESPPVISIATNSIEYELGVNATLSFSVYDQTPSTIDIFLNDTNILSDHYIDLKGYILNLSDIISSPGNYILSIVSTDSFGNIAEENVSITVYPQEAPEIILSPGNNISIYVGEQILLNWSARDRSPDTYTIYINGTQVDYGSWSSEETIAYSFSADRVGTYNITIEFRDLTGLSATKTTMIIVKEKPKGGEIPIALIIAILVAILGIIVAAVLLLRYRKTKE